jgi:hypothetical protein
LAKTDYVGRVYGLDVSHLGLLGCICFAVVAVIVTIVVVVVMAVRKR